MTSGSEPAHERHGVPLSNLDQPLFDDAGATKGDLVDYLAARSGALIAALRDRPLSVIRVTRGQAPFMQKNLPKHAPDWIERVPLWAEASKRKVEYALCNDPATLMWFANQRAIEYHPMLGRMPHLDRVTDLVIDLDPPEGGGGFGRAVEVAHLVRRVLDASGLAGAVKTSGAKGLHVFVPVTASVGAHDAAAATRAIAARVEALGPDLATTAFVKADRGGKVFVDSTRAGGATVVAAYSPRVRPGVPVSFPVSWGDLDEVSPGDFTIHTARVPVGDPWAESLPDPQELPDDLIAEGHAIPVGRVAAMHEGKRRARARRTDDA